MSALALPWHVAQWAKVERAIGAGRLPHAILLRGVPGTGKLAFAERLVARVHCDASVGIERPCGQCRGCTLLRAGSHPDHNGLTPPEDKRSIGVAQVRELIADLTLTTRYEGYKSALVHPAESMTHAAANTLLKTLEEPPGSAVLVLVSGQSTQLPATIRSRCQMIDFHPPAATLASDWLVGQGVEEGAVDDLVRLASGAPLLALELAQVNAAEVRDRYARELRGLVDHSLDPVVAAEGWVKAGMPVSLTAIGAIAVDLARLAAELPQARLVHQRSARTLQAIAGQLDSFTIHRLLDDVMALERAQASQLNLNPQLALEGIAVRWWESGASGRPDA